MPELARMPTEWIHHPWDAPLSVLKASGVELGFNYPKPMIEIDLARERLIEAIFKMWEMDAASRDANSDVMNEVVVDNCEGTKNLAIAKVVENSGGTENSSIPKVLLKERIPCPTISSNDQKVPTVQNSKHYPFNRKRSKYMEGEKPLPDDLHKHNNEAGTSKTDEDLRSTAESSSIKKQTTSRNTFSVPQLSYSSEDNFFPVYDSSDLKQPWQEQINMQQSSNKDCK